MITCALLVAFLQSPAAPSAPPAPEFSCLLAVSIDQHLEDRWYHTSGGEGVGLTSASQVVREQYFVIYPFFSGVAGDEQGRERVEIDVRIVKPDGGTYHETKGALGHDGPAGDPGGVLLSRTLVKACFEPEDALGTYSVELVARNLATGATARKTSKLELVPYAEASSFEDDAAVNAWMDDYFAKPSPPGAIPALLYCAREGLEAEKPRDARGFLREVFEDNHWLFAELEPRFAKLPEHARRAVLWLLARSSCDPQSLVAGLGEADRATWDAIRAAHRDPVEQPIAGREDLNELWGMYLATRRHALLQRLCGALAPDETGVVAQGSDEDDDPIGPVVAEVVEGLLRATARRDKVTRHYLEWLAPRPETPPGVRARIGKILE